jgi:hypothetical protein
VFNHVSRVLAIAATAGLLAACAPPGERLNAPPQGWTSRQAQMQEHYVYMVDNAMMAEMHVSDVHFVPHTDELNSLGARRLDRYASLLKEFGGQINYDTDMKQAALVDARMAKVRKYLEAAGVDMQRVSVEQGPVNVADGSADEAIAARHAVGLSPGDGPTAQSPLVNSEQRSTANSSGSGGGATGQ